jgi:hypothetical protein
MTPLKQLSSLFFDIFLIVSVDTSPVEQAKYQVDEVLLGLT